MEEIRKRDKRRPRINGRPYVKAFLSKVKTGPKGYRIGKRLYKYPYKMKKNGELVKLNNNIIIRGREKGKEEFVAIYY